MVSLSLAEFDAPVRDGGVLPPKLPGLGIEVDRSAFGELCAVWGD